MGAWQSPTLSTQDPDEERINSLSHGLAALVSLMAGMALVTQARAPVAITGVYATTLTVLFLVSAIYHRLPVGPRKDRWQRLDRIAIALLIAGTCTPIALLMVRGWLGEFLCGAEWLLALAGLGVLVIDPPRFLHGSAGLYQAMGWLTAIGARPLVQHVPMGVVVWLALGGLAYIGGVLFLVRDRRRYFHVASHLLVMAGAASQFLAIDLFLMQGEALR
ncbi:MAG: PAQR family membrane homeostasis protein TrhA [Acidiferrobacter sp.]